MITEEVVEALANAWNLFLNLPEERPRDLVEFQQAIHAAQARVLLRSGRRELN
jgi:hypothetical protein